MHKVLTAVALASAMIAGASAYQSTDAQMAKSARTAPAPGRPGFFRMRLGRFEVTAVSDGAYAFSAPTFMTKISAPDLTRRLAAAGLGNEYPQPINTFLVKTPKSLILVDTGLGDFPTKIPALAGILGKAGYGRLSQNLTTAGYTPEQVNEVLITHLHVDHIGGLVRGGKAVFPNAVIRVDQRDLDFWLSDEQRKAHPDMEPLFAAAEMALAPYKAAGRIKPFSGAVELEPGVRTLPTLGHTPGHTAYLFESGGQRLVAWGDVLHVPAVQFAQPGVEIKFDVDPTLAEQTRKNMLSKTERENALVAGAHLDFPGIGHVRKAGQGYRWAAVSKPLR